MSESDPEYEFMTAYAAVIMGERLQFLEDGQQSERMVS